MAGKKDLPLFRKNKHVLKSGDVNPAVLDDAARALGRCSTKEARKCLSHDEALQLNALPVGLIKYADTEVLTVAAPGDNDPSVISLLKFATGREVRIIATDPQILQSAIFYAYKGDGEEVGRAFEKGREAAADGECRIVPEAPDLREERGDAARALEALFDYAVSRGASDIHLIPVRNGSCIKIRINGELFTSPADSCTKALHLRMLARLKILASMDTTRKNTPQDGSFSFCLPGKTIFARISTLPTLHGEKAAIRLLGANSLKRLEDLGFHEMIREAIERILNTGRGIVIFCGPTGSGKSTSMYAGLEYLKDRGLNIVTVEDPVERVIDGISQVSVREDFGTGYEECLRAILRQDPDVILLGEIRDKRSAEVAFQAGLTGHLMFTTIHANTACEVFPRLANLGLDPRMIGASLSLVVGQRLLPRLCRSCRVIDLNSSRLIRCEVFRAVGCADCGYSGYEGRALAAEALIVDRKLQSALSADRPLIPSLNAGNYISFQVSLDRLLRNGSISLEDLKNESDRIGNPA